MSIRMPRTTTSKHLISIIIPIYNTEIFLRSCLDSVLNQTYQNWECILVNDGSSDGSYAICEAYASRDSRFKLFSQQNKGLSAARNAGITLLSEKSDFLLFIDSDDTISSCLLETIATTSAFYPDDILAWAMCAEESEMETVIIKDHQHFIVYEKPSLIDFFFTWNMGSACNKAYPTKFVKKNALLFDTTLRFSEDIAFAFHFFHEYFTKFPFGKIRFCNRPLYWYRSNPGSMTKTIQSDYALWQLQVFQPILPELVQFYQADPSQLKQFYLFLVQTVAVGLSNIYNNNCVLSIKERRKKAKQVLSHPLVKQMLRFLRQEHVYSPYYWGLKAQNGCVVAHLYHLQHTNNPWYWKWYWAGFYFLGGKWQRK